MIVGLLFGATFSSQSAANTIEPAQSTGWPSDNGPFPTSPPYTGPNTRPDPPPAPRPDNPSIRVNCDFPELTIAIMMDRSSSVISETGNATPEIFKDSTKDLIDRLHEHFEPIGRLNILLYAFGTKSVNQNDLASNGSRITDASNDAAITDIKKTIGDIHFVDTENPNSQNNPHHLSGGVSQEALRKAYNAGSTNVIGNYGLTNWHDAFITLRNDAAEIKQTGILGGKVDLALMLTDGLPNVWNGKNNVWNHGSNPNNGSAFVLEKWKNERRTRDIIDLLRSGETSWDSVPTAKEYKINKISVRGIVIRPDIPGLTPGQNQIKNNQAIYIARKIFGKDTNDNDHFFFAKDFSNDLSLQITNLIQVLGEDTVCANGNGQGGISLEINPNNILVEEDDSVTVRFTTSNSGTKLLTEVHLCIGVFQASTKTCVGQKISLGNLEKGDSESRSKLYSVNLGSSVINKTVTAYGHDGTTLQTDSEVLTITPERVALPS